MQNMYTSFFFFLVSWSNVIESSEVKKKSSGNIAVQLPEGEQGFNGLWPLIASAPCSGRLPQRENFNSGI